jgi:hypothetical protein
MSHEHITGRVDSEAPGMGLHGKCAHEGAFRGKSLNPLVAEFGCVDLFVRADGDPDTRISAHSESALQS